MKALAAYLDGVYSCVQIDLTDSEWHRKGGIPNEPGWYFIQTDAPISVLQRQSLLPRTYNLAKTGEPAKVKNYNLEERAGRYSSSLQPYLSGDIIYSGLAAKLMARAREHTFADPGTAGLALHRYPELNGYQWWFYFLTLRRFKADRHGENILLHLGEQIWRAKNGWPILCGK